uniref:Carboxypeptidase O n=1 Tax=Latimeria chalumnae TaxID=7897 RepID=H3A5M5_LATCH
LFFLSQSLFILVVVYSLTGTTESKNRDKVLQIIPANQEQADHVRKLSEVLLLDQWKHQVPDRTHPLEELHIFVPADSLQEVENSLREQSILFKILIENVQEFLEIQMSTHHSRHSRATNDYIYTKYHPMDEVYLWMEQIREQYGEVVTKHFLGMTYENREIYYLKIGKQSDKPKKIIWMDCGIHAREWISPAFCQWFVKEILNHYKSDPMISLFLQDIDFYVLPVLNIDGYIYSWTNERLWRKSRSPSSKETCPCVGTDLNRNFPAEWCSVGASRNCCSQLYCGAGPASEPEVKAVVDFVGSRLADILCFLTIHSYGQLILTPYGYTKNASSNHDEMMRVAKASALALKEKYGTEYKVGPSSWILYESSGSSRDWARYVGIEFSYTFELRDNGTYGFILPPEQIQPTCEETMAGVMTIIKLMHEKHFPNTAPTPVTVGATVLLSCSLSMVHAL